MKTPHTTVRRKALALLALAVSVIVGSLAGPARATDADQPQCAEGQGMCVGQYVGYVGMRAPVLKNGRMVWILRLADGSYTEVTSAPENAYVVAAEEAWAQIATYQESYIARRLLSRSEYQAATFRNVDRPEPPLFSPALRTETTFVSVEDDANIRRADDIVLFQYTVDPRVQVPATGSLLFDRNGVKLASSPAGTYAYLTDFLEARSGDPPSRFCGGKVGDLLTFEQCPLRSLALLAPLRGVEIDSSSHWGFGDRKVTTDPNGRYVLPYRYAQGWAYIPGDQGVPDPFRLQPIVPPSDMVVVPIDFANPVDNMWVMMRYNGIEPRIQLGGLHIEERQTRGGEGKPSGDIQHVGIEVSMLVGTGVLYNDPSSEFWAGDIPPGPIPIDDVSEQTEYSYVRPGPPPAGQRAAPDLKDRGFLKQINRSDLSNTDLYVFDMAGKLLSERSGLRANETDGLECDTPSHCTLPPGDYQARFNFQGMVKDPGFDSRVKIVLINRATGYIGTGFANRRGDTLPLLVPENDILMRPPNLTVRLRRTREDDRVQAVGFEGSGLLSDEKIVVYTDWKDWDGSPLPFQLTAGFTGRIARVVEPNKLAPDVQGEGTTDTYSGLFAILPGSQTQVLKLPNASDLAHFYLHVSPEPIEGTPDFSERTQGGPPFQYRPTHYAPFKVELFDPPEEIDPREDLSFYYRTVYRPEQHFSLIDLEAQNLDIVTNNGATSTNVFDDPDAPIRGDISSIELLYDLAQGELPELQRFGQERTYVFSLGGVDKEVTFGSNKFAVWEPGDFGGAMKPSDLLGIRLVQEGDEGNALADYGLSLIFHVTPVEEEGEQQISADNNFAEVEAEVKMGFTPVQPGTVVRWVFVEGSAPISLEAGPTNRDGFAQVAFETSHRAGDTYRLRGILEQVQIGNEVHVLDPPYEAQTALFRVVPGKIPPTGFQGVTPRLAFPADGTTLITMDVLLHDSWGNTPLDHTPVTWLLDGTATFEAKQDEVNSGRTGALMRAPELPGPQKVEIVVDGIKSPPTNFRANRLVSRMDVDTERIEIGSVDRVTLTATFKDVEDNPVALNTSVGWTATNGKVTAVGGTGDSHLVTDEHGVARAWLAAPKKDTKIGPTRVIATAGATTALSPVIDAYSNDPNVMIVDRTALVFAVGPYRVEPPLRTEFSETLLDTLEPIPVFAETPVELKGTAGQRPRIKLDEYGSRLLVIDGLDADGKATIGNDGRKKLTIKRREGAEFFPSPSEGVEVPTYATACMDLDNDGTCEWETKIALIAVEGAIFVGSFVYGFATGDGNDLGAIAGDFASSWAIYGDLRDIAKTGLQAVRLLPGEPDILVASLSAVSLAPVLGLNETTGALKVIVKRLPLASHASKFLVKLASGVNKAVATEKLRERINGLLEVMPYAAMLASLDKPDQEALDKLNIDEEAFKRASELYSRIVAEFGDEIGSTVAKNFFLKLVRHINDPALGANAAEYMVRVLHGMDNATLRMFASLTTEEGNAVIAAFARVAGKIDPWELAKALGNRLLFGQNYLHKDLLKDLGDLAHVAGVESVVKALKQSNNQVHGHKYEIQVAAAIERDPPRALAGCKVLGMSMKRVITPSGNESPLGTDIDTLIKCPGDRVMAVQVKRNARALRNLSEVQRWVSKMTEGKLKFQHEDLVYVVGGRDAIPPDIKAYFDKAPVTLVVRNIPELNPLD